MGAEGTAEMARTRAIVVFIDRRFAESTKKSIRSRVHVLEQNLEAATTSQSVVLRCWPDQHEETEGSQGEVGEGGGGGGGHGADKAAFVREHEKRSSSGADGNVSSSGWRDMDAISNLTKDLNEDAIVDILWYCFPPSLRSLSLSLSRSSHLCSVLTLEALNFLFKTDRFAFRIGGEKTGGSEDYKLLTERPPVEELQAYALLKESKAKFPNSVRHLVVPDIREASGPVAKDLTEMFDLNVVGLVKPTEEKIDQLFSQLGLDVLWRGNAKFSSDFGAPENMIQMIDFVRVTNGSDRCKGGLLIGSGKVHSSVLVSKVVPIASIALHRLKTFVAQVKVVSRDEEVQSWFDTISSSGDKIERAVILQVSYLHSHGKSTEEMVLLPSSGWEGESRGEKGEKGNGVCFSLVKLTSSDETMDMLRLMYKKKKGVLCTRNMVEEAVCAFLEKRCESQGYIESDVYKAWPELFPLFCCKKPKISLGKKAKAASGKGTRLAAKKRVVDWKRVEKVFKEDGTLKGNLSSCSAGLVKSRLAKRHCSGLSPRSAYSAQWVYEYRRQCASATTTATTATEVNYWSGSSSKTRRKKLML